MHARSSVTRFALAALIATAGSACGYPPEPGAPANAMPVAMLGFPDTIINVRASGWDLSHRRTIRSSVEWKQYWDTLTLGVTGPIPPAPAVDFDKDMVIAVAYGWRPTPHPGGAARVVPADPSSRANQSLEPAAFVFIDGVYELGEDLWVQVTLRTASQTCERAHTETPVTAVRVPRHDGDVTFMHRDETIYC